MFHWKKKNKSAEIGGIPIDLGQIVLNNPESGSREDIESEEARGEEDLTALPRIPSREKGKQKEKEKEEETKEKVKRKGKKLQKLRKPE